MSIHRPDISSLWIGGTLSYIELLSLRSMVDWGHRVRLYHYEPITNAPDWLELDDANKVLPLSAEQLKDYGDSLTIISNFFRYHLMAKTKEVWCDCDVYFLRPLQDEEIIIFNEKVRPIRTVATSLLRLPKDSDAVKGLIKLFETDKPVIPDSRYFFDERGSKRADLELLGGNGNVHVRDMAWGTTGPRALSYFIDTTGLSKYGKPRIMHMPVAENQIGAIARKRATAQINLPMNCQSLHYYGSVLRRKLIGAGVFKNNEPMEGSFLYERMVDHDIDPAAYPLLTATDRASHMDARRAKLEELKDE